MCHSRIVAFLLALGIVSTGLLASESTVAQEGTPTAMDGHPLVGAWVLDPDVDDPVNPPELYVFTADGLVIGAEYRGGDVAGVWEATGPREATVTLVFLTPDESEAAFGGMVRVRGTITVAKDGQSFTGPYTLEFETPEGAGSGQFGPATVTATRLNVEAMGTPVGSMAELFGGAAATPTP